MKDFNDYECNLPYDPDFPKKDYIDDLIKDFVGTKNQIKKREEELATKYDLLTRKIRDAYHEENNRLYEVFKKDLFEDLGILDNPKREKLFSKAWEKGHSCGYSEVYGEACDLVELIKD